MTAPGSQEGSPVPGTPGTGEPSRGAATGGLARGWWPPAVLVALLAVATWAAAAGGPQLTEVPVAPPAAGDPEQPGEPLLPTLGPQPTLPPEDLEGVSWLGWLPAALLVLLLAGVAAALVMLVRAWLLPLLTARSWVRRRALPVVRTAAGPAGAGAEVAAAVDAGLTDLDDADLDPRRAVIACWVRLERAAAAAGTPRQAGDAPTDLVTRLLAGHAVSPDLLAGLADLYRRARYARRAVDADMRATARAALGRLQAELAAPATSAPATSAPAEAGEGGS